MTFEASDFRAPVPVDLAQWPEARGFVRVYTKDPDQQARFVMALLGFKQDLLEWQKDTESAAAIDTLLRAFCQHFPEFMIDGYERDGDTVWGRGSYHLDDRLLTYLEEIGITPPESPAT